MSDIAIDAPARPKGLLPGAATILAVSVYGWALLTAEEDWQVIGLLVLAAAVGLVGKLAGLGPKVLASWSSNEATMNGGAVLGLLAVIFALSTQHFPLLMLTTTLLYFIASLGLNIQFGYTGMVNFAGAAFFGAGAYTAAVLGGYAWIPPLLTILAGGVVAMVLSLLLVYPIVRTTGHYAAVVTIAFGVLFKTFLEVNEILGGPQGLMVESMKLPGWDFNNGPVLFGVEMSFYLNYALFATALVALIFCLVRRLERSWLGLHMDAVRLDETAAACFGISVHRTKILAFLSGNFILGIAGALYGMMISFIAPASFTFSDSLLMVSIVLLGGMGSPWGGALAAAIVVLLPEKLQVLQEYRFLLFSVLVMLVLLFRPDGLLPRQIRNYFPGREGGK
ncbi:amino acid/amide ABC transporter membrane protein 2 (HAAT family) [Breoghania corrubedonensis]|uniref:Amino acid/amide ABC transporter membrane protein 2 (HAAT family) n=1 Tax=Breoghania corrubedonensis TaxID=665038 RepID=A0A2T5VI47_9HYPH|nr:branched-chain amino acid ABC transporter permease [Breoghania corrubedonensis]PTW63432.1 amino acid/amide ABC transporter membrane protein 2 (HAAT family) [Breoghania corrubedonensis]